MAEAVISALMEVIFQKTVSQVLEEYGLLCGTKKEMRNLQSILSTIQAVLEDAEDLQVTEKALKNWLMKLKDVAYEADDLLDEYMIEALRYKEIHDNMEIRGCIIDGVRHFFSQSNPVVFCHKMGCKLKEIGENLDAIASERFKFHLRDKIINRTDFSFGRLQSDSYLPKSEVFGREEDMEKIVKLLIETNACGDVLVIPIVGMGGLGKTTLAKLAYNDERVEKYFEKRIWVCVSEDFDVKRLMKAIVESATGSRCDLQEMEAILHRIQELIMGKKFLLVLDDVWSDDHEKWDRLKNAVRHSSEGSKILVTTRNEKVALIMGTISPYHLEGLSEDDCWSVFEQRAYKYRKPEQLLELVAIGKEIAKKCRGVPLAAKALGSLMCLKRQKTDWLSVRDSEMWKLMEDEDGILSVLRLSYNHLPPHLKQCFAYCSIFPKDYWIKKENLILLWMAEGFIQPSERKMPEEIGNDYFNELLWRSFFQNVMKDSDGNIMECQMHDLVHDLAKSVAGIDCSTVELGSQVIKTGTRHLSMVCKETVFEIPKALRNAQKVRSFLLLFGRRRIKRVSRTFFLSLKSIHALDLSGTGIKKLAKSIGTLKHLRYLNLSDALIKKLPKSICGLFYLQTLILMHCNLLEKLPGDIRKLVNLRHLNIYGCRSLTRLPHGIGKLSSLQTLPIFIVGKEPALNIAELQSLDLRGELEIMNLEKVHNARCAKDANLKEKRKLQSLRLKWEHVDEASARENVDEASARENVELIIESLEPNPVLKKLHIENYAGVKFPSWMMNLSLSNIVELSLIKCQRCSQLPLLGKLSALEVLTIDGMDAVMYFCNDSAGNSGINNFALLKQLSLKNMANFLGWSTVEGSLTLPSLKKLICESCPKLSHLPNLPSTESLEMNDCSSELLKAVSKVNSLSNLIISGFLELISLPQGLLRNKTHLLSLEIRDCPKLRFLSGELTDLCALQSLIISNCDELESLSELGSLKALKSFSIYGCSSLIIFPEEGMESLKSLQHFWLSDCDNLTALPEAMQHLTGLQTLHIFNCFKLDALPEWLGNLVSLRELEIWYCENLCHLPESMTRLTIQFLSIWGCPRLEIVCNETGEDWHKIQHIPFIKVNGPYIQVING